MLTAVRKNIDDAKVTMLRNPSTLHVPWGGTHCDIIMAAVTGMFRVVTIRSARLKLSMRTLCTVLSETCFQITTHNSKFPTKDTSIMIIKIAPNALLVPSEEHPFVTRSWVSVTADSMLSIYE